MGTHQAGQSAARKTLDRAAGFHVPRSSRLPAASRDHVRPPVFRNWTQWVIVVRRLMATVLPFDSV